MGAASKRKGEARRVEMAARNKKRRREPPPPPPRPTFVSDPRAVGAGERGELIGRQRGLLVIAAARMLAMPPYR